MPLHRELLKKRWSPVDLPILPFLAPRVFQPWPCNLRRSHSEATQSTHSRQQSHIRSHDNLGGGPLGQVYAEERRAQESEDEGQSSRGQYSRYTPIGIRQGISAKDASTAADQHEEVTNEFQGSRKGGQSSHGGYSRYAPIGSKQGNSAKDTLTATVQHEENFLNKYKEIWGNTDVPPRHLNKLASISSIKPESQKARDDMGADEGDHRHTEHASVDNLHTPAPAIHPPVLYGPLYVRNIIRRIEGEMPYPDISQFISSVEDPSQRLEMHHKNQAKVHYGHRLLRTKWVRFDPKSQDHEREMFSFWNGGFAALNVMHRRFKRGPQRPRLSRKRVTKDASRYLSKLIHLPSSVLEKTWESMPEKHRIIMWPSLMMEALENHTSHALRVLECTYKHPFPQAYAVSDSLEFIVTFYLRYKSSSTTHFAIDLIRTISLLLRRSPENQLHLSQKTIHTLLSCARIDDLEAIYNCLVEVKAPLHFNTLLHFSSRFMKEKKMELGYEIFKDIVVHQQVDFEQSSMLSMCTTILAHPSEDSGPQNQEFERFQFMLAHGLKPNVIIYNTLIKNAISRDDPDTGWRVHDMMSENGIEPDHFTYSLLLHDAKLRMNPSAITDVMSHLRASGIMSPHVITDILHTILLLHRQEGITAKRNQEPASPREPAFQKMLKVYCENFGTGALEGLIPGFKEVHLATQTPGIPPAYPALGLDPPVPTLVVMLSGLLYDLDSAGTKKLYDHIYHLVISGDPIACRVMGTTYMWNQFLFSLRTFPDMVDECTQLVGNMLSLASKSIPIQEQIFYKVKNALEVEQEPALPDGDDITKGSQSHIDINNSEKESKVSESALVSSGLAQARFPPEETPIDSSPETPDPFAASSSTIPNQEPTLDSTDVPHFSDPDPNNTTPSQPTEDLSSNTTTHTIHRAIINSDPKIFTCPSPDVFTWSILLRVFTQRKQLRAAEKVMEAMQERGIAPTDATWNTLAYGYSLTQDPEMVAETVGRMKDGGFEPDEVTMKAFEFVRDRRRMAELLKLDRPANGNKGSGVKGSGEKGEDEDDVEITGLE